MPPSAWAARGITSAAKNALPIRNFLFITLLPSRCEVIAQNVEGTDARPIDEREWSTESAPAAVEAGGWQHGLSTTEQRLAAGRPGRRRRFGRTFGLRHFALGFLGRLSGSCRFLFRLGRLLLRLSLPLRFRGRACRSRRDVRSRVRRRGCANHPGLGGW